MSNQEFENVFAEDRKKKMMYAAVGIGALIILTVLGAWMMMAAAV